MHNLFVCIVLIGGIAIAGMLWAIILKTLFKKDKFKGLAFVSIICSAVFSLPTNLLTINSKNILSILSWISLCLGVFFIIISIIQNKRRKHI
ncbi:hypothetical protein KDN24_10775 [Bacillus sp. Bva_UNVM-123]|uniref:hypothetical protein n=1 Tax=Bacillus sp. Bva_UNVM-123 TaxID=2829798 RepID=UPI00391F96D2